MNSCAFAKNQITRGIFYIIVTLDIVLYGLQVVSLSGSQSIISSSRQVDLQRNVMPPGSHEIPVAPSGNCIYTVACQLHWRQPEEVLVLFRVPLIPGDAGMWGPILITIRRQKPTRLLPQTSNIHWTLCKHGELRKGSKDTRKMEPLLRVANGIDEPNSLVRRTRCWQQS